MYKVPGKIKIKMAANAPRICITTPMFGINTARASVRTNQIMVTDTRRLNSVCSILSGLILKMSVHRQSRAALKKQTEFSNQRQAIYFIGFIKIFDQGCHGFNI